MLIGSLQLGCTQKSYQVKYYSGKYYNATWNSETKKFDKQVETFAKPEHSIVIRKWMDLHIEADSSLTFSINKGAYNSPLIERGTYVYWGISKPNEYDKIKRKYVLDTKVPMFNKDERLLISYRTRANDSIPMNFNELIVSDVEIVNKKNLLNKTKKINVEIVTKRWTRAQVTME